MAEYGAGKVYDEKTGKYIGMYKWVRPTDEITPEERRKREARFNRACFDLLDHVEQERAEREARGEPPKPSILDSFYTEKVEVTPEMIAGINAALGPIERC